MTSSLLACLVLIFMGLTSSLACKQLEATDESQEFESTNYPEDYEPLASDCWVITSVSPSKNVVLFPSDFYTDGYDDYLAFYDGDSSNSDQLARWSSYVGSSTSVSSTGSTMYLTWNTNEFGQAKGFKLRFIALTVIRTDCLELEANATTQAIYSPGFGSGFYAHNSDVCWKISGNAGVIIVKFGVLDLQYSSSCRQDNVTIHDGDTTPTTLLGSYCDQADDQIVEMELDTNTIYVRFRTDASCCESHGFSLYFSTETINPANGGLCEYLWTDYYPAYISSPNYPSAYDTDIDACFNIAMGDYYRNNVYIDIVDFQLEDGEPCKDYVRIYEGSDTSGTLLAELCGSVQSYSVTASERAHIVFHSDGDTVSRGFRIKYASYDKTMTHYIAHEAGSTLTSPSFPGNYPPNEYYEWVLKADSETGRVHLTIKDFRLEAGDDCQHDYLEIRDGQEGYSPLQALLCGDTIERNNYYSSGRYMFLRMVTDSNEEYSGFQADYYMLKNTSQDICTVLDVSSDVIDYYFESPQDGYVAGYSLCFLLISRNKRDIGIDISSHGGYGWTPDYSDSGTSDNWPDSPCSETSLALYDGNSTDQLSPMTVLCSEDYSDELYELGPYVTLVIDVHRHVAGIGFYVHYAEMKPGPSTVGLVLGTLIPVIIITILTIIIYRVCTRPTANTYQRHETGEGMDTPTIENGPTTNPLEDNPEPNIT